MGRLVIIDAGHGGKFPGAVANGIVEKDYVLLVAQLTQKIFKSEGVPSFLTRDTDEELAEELSDDLGARCKMVNAMSPQPDLFISIHCNAAESPLARGFEVWTSPGETKSDIAATEMLLSYAKTFPGRPIRKDMSDGDGDKEAKFRVLVGTACPAVLLELDFISNAEAAQFLCETATSVSMAAMIVSAALSYFDKER